MRRGIGLSHLIIYTILIILWALLQGCHPVFVSEDRMTLYSKPAGSYSGYGYVPQARPLVWVWVYDAAGSDVYYPVHAGRTAEQMLIGCGFSSAGVAFSSSYGERMSPPHQLRLDLEVSEGPSPAFYQDRLGYAREYRTVHADARLVRASDGTLIASGQGHGAYSADGKAHDIIQARIRIRSSGYTAVQAAVEGAVRSVCGDRGRVSGYYDAPAPYVYDALLGRRTLCGYGASGRVTRKGAWDMRYDCRKY